jgi:hypothetical protein
MYQHDQATVSGTGRTHQGLAGLVGCILGSHKISSKKQGRQTLVGFLVLLLASTLPEGNLLVSGKLASKNHREFNACL